MRKPSIRWIASLSLWYCTDGTIHGGGETPVAAYEDYRLALAEEAFDATVGWS